MTVGEDAIQVRVNSSSTISNFGLDVENKKISFNVSGTGAAGGMTEIYIESILEGPYLVTVDGQVINNVKMIESSEPHMSKIEIAHAHDSQVITVAGTNVVPEFPIHAIWIASLAGIVIAVARFKGAWQQAGAMARLPYNEERPHRSHNSSLPIQVACTAGKRPS